MLPRRGRLQPKPVSFSFRRPSTSFSRDPIATCPHATCSSEHPAVNRRSRKGAHCARHTRNALKFSLTTTRRNPTRKTTWFDSKLRHPYAAVAVRTAFSSSENMTQWFSHSDVSKVFSFARPLEETLHATYLVRLQDDPPLWIVRRVDGTLLSREQTLRFLHSGARKVFSTSPRSEPTRNKRVIRTHWSRKPIAPHGDTRAPSTPTCVLCDLRWPSARRPRMFSRVHQRRANTHSGIAHSVEHQIRNLSVAGSNPVSKTLALAQLGHVVLFFAQRPLAETLHAKQLGSTPSSATSCSGVAVWTAFSSEDASEPQGEPVPLGEKQLLRFSHSDVSKYFQFRAPSRRYPTRKQTWFDPKLAHSTGWCRTGRQIA
jgi:hypothetical protein